MSLENKTMIREYISRTFRSYELKDDEDIFSLGFVNSMFAMELIVFIEQTFGISIENEDLEFENFSTICSMSEFIEHKQTNPAE